MKNSGKFQNSMRAVTINSEFSLPGLKIIVSYCTLLFQKHCYSSILHGNYYYNCRYLKQCS